MTLPTAQDSTPRTADFSAIDAAYVSPTYLRTPFREYLLQNGQGVYWLRGPERLGKTLFVRGITARRPGRDPAEREGIDSAISSDVRAFGVHVRPGETPAGLLGALDDAFAEEFALAAEAVGAAAPTADDFIARLNRWHAHVAGTGAKRLLVCIDGLERMAEGVLATIVPPAASVPPGVILLLTSRPVEEGPQDVANLPADGVRLRDVSYADADYTDMLRRYFRDRTRPLLRRQAATHLGQLLETKAAFERGGRDNRLTNDPGLRDGLKDDWKKLTNKYPRYTGLPLPVAPLVPLLDQFDQLWIDIIDRAGQRFGDLSAMLDALAAQTLRVEEVAALPKGEALRAHLQALPGAGGAG